MSEKSDYLCQKLIYINKSMKDKIERISFEHFNNNVSAFVREAIQEKFDRMEKENATRVEGGGDL